jgi:membrane protein YdbS with pleckstrin-like domain
LKPAETGHHPHVGIPNDPEAYLLASERRVIRVRRHWAVVVWDVFEAVALLAVAVMVSLFLLPPGMWLFQNILWYGGLLVVLRLAYKLYEWWDEILVVTDKRFVLSTGIFTTKIAMMPLTKVTDLTYERSANGRMLGYGTLIVESAGQFQAFNRIDHLPQPERVYDAISELVFGDKQAQEERFSMIRAQRLARGKRIVA